MKVVVVESPAKAKTINKYLGADFTVIASYGHVRDLPAKDGSVRPDQDFEMDWSLEDRGKARIAEIAKLVKGAEAVYLATDPDREGEAISWHVRECLEERKLLKGMPVRRVVFHEVTKTAVQEAFRQARDIDADLVDAYRARRALDYLVGFTLSPILWRKLPGSRSAGRVQSVALRLICERESEIEVFKPQEYWSIEVDLATAKGDVFTARLSELNGRKLDKMSLKNGAEAAAARAVVESAAFKVAEVERKQSKRNPQPPFTTSTLQQEASRKLGFGASRTMQIAQRLYEGIELDGETVGLISYMRTDGVQLSGEAIVGARALISETYGARYLPEAPRVYKTKAKNAQEAHEAVRPTDMARRPTDVARFLEPEQLRLYDLIWKRTLASQMESAIIDQVAADIWADHGRCALRATGSSILFDGFLTLYQEGRDDIPAAGPDDEAAGMLPRLNAGDDLARRDVRPDQHFTQPPPRYSEASLIKKLEELGIGRPSTYTSIIHVLQERDYVKLEQKRFVPEDRGRLVTAFLSSFFDRYVEYGFTADLEDQLDAVSDGKLNWRTLLRRFWDPFIAKIGETKDLKISEVIDTLDALLGPHFFPDPGNGTEPRACPSCKTGRLGLRLGKTGGFLGCSNYPECRYTRALGVEGDGAAGDGEAGDGSPRDLGLDPVSGLMVALRKGPFGFYVQLGEAAAGDKTAKPKRASLPRGMTPAAATLESALALLALPRELGLHPETQLPISAGLGRFGPYLKLGPTFKSLPKDEDVLTIGLNRAVVLLAEEKKRPGLLRMIGAHPDDAKEINLHEGRYGNYISHGAVRATLPTGTDGETMTVDEAVALLKERGKVSAGKSGSSRGKPPARKTAAPVKKPAPAAKAKTAQSTAKPAAKTAGKTVKKAAPKRAAKRAEPS